MSARRRRSERPREEARREGILHHNLLLVRTASAQQLNRLLARADLRRRCVRRLGEDTALFQRSALPVLRKRLNEHEMHAVFRSTKPPGNDRDGP